MLKFSPANTKTKKLATIPELAKYLEGGRKIYSLDLPAGLTCPGAKDCKSMAVIGLDGKVRIKDGPDCQFRCFSASQEILFPNVYKVRRHNLAALLDAKTTQNTHLLLEYSLPKNAGIIRYHVAGDFFSPNYFRAAIKLAKCHPDILFYAYTKSLHHLIRLDCQNLAQGIILPNFRITASCGGKYDSFIEDYGIRFAKVVYSKLQAEKLGLPLDDNDSHAANIGGNFALLIHGTQPKGTQAAKIVYDLYYRKGK